MADAMILTPIAALILPGIVAFGLGRAMKSLWPGLILVVVALGSGIFFMSQASGADWSDQTALNNMFAAFGISLPALISALIGGTLAHVRKG